MVLTYRSSGVKHRLLFFGLPLNYVCCESEVITAEILL